MICLAPTCDSEIFTERAEFIIMQKIPVYTKHGKEYFDLFVPSPMMVCNVCGRKQASLSQIDNVINQAKHFFK